jgi:hypothetical protein
LRGHQTRLIHSTNYSWYTIVHKKWPANKFKFNQNIPLINKLHNTGSSMGKYSTKYCCDSRTYQSQYKSLHWLQPTFGHIHLQLSWPISFVTLLALPNRKSALQLQKLFWLHLTP